MTKYGSPDAWLMLGGNRLTGYLTDYTDKLSAKLEESYTLGDSWVENEHTGVREAELSINGFADDTATEAPIAVLSNVANIGSKRVLCFGVEGMTSGQAFVGWSVALQPEFNWITKRGELNKFSANFKLGAGGKAEDGLIIKALGNVSASGNTTGGAAGIDFGGSATEGGAAYVQVVNLTTVAGTSMVAVDIMHSVDNLAFSSWLGFSNITSAEPLAERIGSTVTIERYAAARWQGSSGGGFVSSANFFVGLARRILASA